MVLGDCAMDDIKKVRIYFENRPDRAITPKELEKATKLSTTKVRSAINKLMTQEMNQENNRGIAATWRYNLNKEMGGADQAFEKVEPKEVMGSNFISNFYQIKSYWTAPA